MGVRSDLMSHANVSSAGACNEYPERANPAGRGASSLVPLLLGILPEKARLSSLRSRRFLSRVKQCERGLSDLSVDQLRHEINEVRRTLRMEGTGVAAGFAASPASSGSDFQ